MNIKQLHQIVRVAKHENLSMAARELNISQPALSRSVQAAETELGIELFDRSTRKFKINTQGERFLRRARAILAEWNRCKMEISQAASHSGDALSINGSPLTIAGLIPDAIAQLTRSQTHSVFVSVGDPNEVLEDQLRKLRRGQYDVLVSIIDRPAVEDGLRRRILLTPELKIVCRKDHPALAIKNPTLRDLKQFPWITPPMGTKPRVLVDGEFRKLGLLPPEFPLELTARNMILPTIRRSDYLAILPFHAVCAEDDWATLGEVIVPLEQTSWPIGIITRYATEPSPALTAFQDILTNILQGHNTKT